MKKVLFIMSAIGGMLLLSTFSGLAQEEVANFQSAIGVEVPIRDSVPAVANIQTSEATEESAAACSGSSCIYLPALIKSPSLDRGGAYYKSSCSASNFALRDIQNGGAVTLIGRPRILAFSARAAGYQGSTYSTQFVFNGQELGVSSSGVISSQDEYIGTNTLVYSSTGSCSSQLPTGTYTGRFMIDKQLITEYTVIIN